MPLYIFKEFVLVLFRRSPGVLNRVADKQSLQLILCFFCREALFLKICYCSLFLQRSISRSRSRSSSRSRSPENTGQVEFITEFGGAPEQLDDKTSGDKHSHTSSPRSVFCNLLLVLSSLLTFTILETSYIMI